MCEIKSFKDLRDQHLRGCITNTVAFLNPPPVKGPPLSIKHCLPVNGNSQTPFDVIHLDPFLQVCMVPVSHGNTLIIALLQAKTSFGSKLSGNMPYVSINIYWKIKQIQIVPV